MKPPDPGDRRRARLRSVLLCLPILLLTAALFAPTLSFPFLDLDDGYFVVENPGIQQLSWETVRFLFFEDQRDFRYYPLAYLSWAAEHHFFGKVPLVFHATNVLLHLANVALLFLFVVKLSGRLPVAVVSSLFFAIHPLQVESVAWIMQRRNLLFFLFFLLAMLCYLGHLRRSGRGVAGAALLATHGLFLLSVLSKTAGVTLPAVLLLIDFHHDAPGRGGLASFLRRRLPSKLLFLPVIVFAYVMTRQAAARSPFVTEYAYRWWEWLVLTGHNLAFYPFKALVPTGLAVFYPTPTPGALSPQHHLLAAASLGLFALLAWSWRRRRGLFWGLAFYLATISPMAILTLFFSDLPFLTADRFFYQSAVGLFFVLGSAFDALWRRSGRGASFLLGLALGLLAATSFALSAQQRQVWRSTRLLYEQLVEHHPSDEFQYRLAFEYDAAGESEKAFRALEQAERAPHRIFFTKLFYFQFRLSELYQRKGELQKAARFLAAAIEATPNQIEPVNTRTPLAYLYLADLYARAGEPEREAWALRRAESAAIDPAQYFERLFLQHAASVDFLTGRVAEHPEDGMAWYYLAEALDSRGDEGRAAEYRREASRLGFRPPVTPGRER